jgi:hypothetical protein
MAIKDFLTRTMTVYAATTVQNPDGSPETEYEEVDTDIPCNVQPRGDYGARKREPRGGRMTLVTEHYIYTNRLVTLRPNYYVDVTPGLYADTDTYRVVIGDIEDQAGTGRFYRFVVEKETT